MTFCFRKTTDRAADEFSFTSIADMTEPVTIPGPYALEQDDLDGVEDLTECDHCGSVHGPEEREYHLDALCVGGTERFQ
jgi:hypothetical protein